MQFTDNRVPIRPKDQFDFTAEYVEWGWRKISLSLLIFIVNEDYHRQTFLLYLSHSRAPLKIYSLQLQLIKTYIDCNKKHMERSSLDDQINTKIF